MGLNVCRVRRKYIDYVLETLALATGIFHFSIIVTFDDNVNSRRAAAAKFGFTRYNRFRTELSRPEMTTQRLLSVDEVADWLGVSTGWVRDHAAGRRRPRLPAIKLGDDDGKGLWRFQPDAIEDFIRKQSRQ
jgi:hypothetical protein